MDREFDTLVEDKAGAPSKRGFGLATAAFIVVSSMIGTGVLTTSGFTVHAVGSNGLMLVLWIVGGIVAFCGALSLSELSAALPESGGDYVFLREAYGPLIAFLSGWVSFLIGFGGPIASAAFGSAKYLLKPLALTGTTSNVAQKAVATAAVVALALIHSSGRTGTIRLQAVTTTVKLLVLGSLAAVGLAAGWGHWENLNDVPTLTLPLIGKMGLALVYIAYAYTGWNGASYLAGEIERPQRTLPRAILLGTSTVLALYFALNLSYALALSVADVEAIINDPSNQEGVNAVAPIAELAAESVLGDRIAGPLSVAVGVTLLATTSAFVLAGPRVLCAMAEAGQFPGIAARRSARTGAPVIATWLQVAWSIVLLWSGSFEQLLIYSSVGLALFSMLSVASVIVLRIRRPELPRPFRCPGYPVVPLIYLLVTAGLVSSAFLNREQTLAALASLGSILLGVPIYYLIGALRKRSPEVTPDGPSPS